MKQQAMKNTMDLLHKIESIEKEIKDSRIYILKRLSPSGKKIIRLKGIIKCVVPEFRPSLPAALQTT